MTEELEKKLNELLELKEQVEKLNAHNEKFEASSVFEEKKRKTRRYYYIWFAITLGIMIFGMAGIFMNTGKYQITSLFYALLGFESNVLIKMWYHTICTKLAILEEMKQFELRITEMLKK